jgi:hypothetical protein
MHPAIASGSASEPIHSFLDRPRQSMRPIRQPVTSGDLDQKIVPFPIFDQPPPHEVGDSSDTTSHRTYPLVYRARPLSYKQSIQDDGCRLRSPPLPGGLVNRGFQARRWRGAHLPDRAQDLQVVRVVHDAQEVLEGIYHGSGDEPGPPAAGGPRSSICFAHRGLIYALRRGGRQQPGRLLVCRAR